MSRRFITELADHENIDQVFLATDKQLRANRAGNLYLQLRLSDRTGSITGMLWNANERIYDSFDKGDYLRVFGTTQIHQGNLQMIVTRFERADAGNIDEADFITLGPRQIDGLASRVAELLRGMRNVALRGLAECFLADEEFMAKFTSAPAGIKNHHAYNGGLLEHVLSVMELAALVGPRYPDVDPDLLLIGAFLHDAGKVDELIYDREMGYSDEGQLLGHMVIGVEMVDRKARETETLSGESFPPELLYRVKHMILSHHGTYENGSSKLPMTLEALALHYLDTLDAKLHSVGQIIKTDATPEGNWTGYQPNLERKFFKGGREESRANGD